MTATPTLAVAGESLILLPERAVLWPAAGALIVADVHLGKESAFGRAGLAIPDGATQSDLTRLTQLIAVHRPARLIVLGDLVHARPARDARWPAQLSAWLDAHPALRVSVIAGNHDRPATRRALDPRLVWHTDPHLEGPFVLAHEPVRSDRGYVLCGHIHPAVRLKTRSDAVRAPGFWFTDTVGVLPAFGRFTGGYNVRPGRNDRVFMALPEAVVSVTGAVHRGQTADRPWDVGPG